MLFQAPSLMVKLISLGAKNILNKASEINDSKNYLVILIISNKLSNCSFYSYYTLLLDITFYVKFNNSYVFINELKMT